MKRACGSRAYCRHCGVEIRVFLGPMAPRLNAGSDPLPASATDLGGNWIASTPDAEADIVERFADIERLLPFGDWDASLLRLALREADHGERVPFEKHLQRDKLRLRFRRRLRTWVERCDCNLRRPKLKTCEPHQAITAMEQFTILIDREWYRLANRYHLPPETVSAERNNVKHYFLHADPENYDLARLDRAAQGAKPGTR